MGVNGYRVSTPLQWAFTGDAAVGYDAKLVFIRGKPNDTENYNAVLVKKLLPSLDVEFLQPTIKKAYNMATNDQKLKNKVDNTIVVEGADLIGDVFLRKKGSIDIGRQIVFVKNDVNNPLMGDLTEIRVVIRPSRDAAEKGWELVIKNSKGEASIAGFEIVD